MCNFYFIAPILHTYLGTYAAYVICHNGYYSGTGGAESSGAPDLTPNLLGLYDMWLAIVLILYLWHTYFVIKSSDSGL